MADLKKVKKSALAGAARSVGEALGQQLAVASVSGADAVMRRTGRRPVSGYVAAGALAASFAPGLRKHAKTALNIALSPHSVRIGESLGGMLSDAVGLSPGDTNQKILEKAKDAAQMAAPKVSQIGEAVASGVSDTAERVKEAVAN